MRKASLPRRIILFLSDTSLWGFNRKFILEIGPQSGESCPWKFLCIPPKCHLGAGCCCSTCVHFSPCGSAEWGESNEDSRHPQKNYWAPELPVRGQNHAICNVSHVETCCCWKTCPSQPPHIVCLPESGSDSNNPCCRVLIYLERTVYWRGCSLAHFINLHVSIGRNAIFTVFIYS